MLKKSFLTTDLLNYFITRNVKKIDSEYNDSLVNELIEFKDGEFGESIRDGIEALVNKYEGNYYLTREIQDDLQDYFIKSQQELLEKLEFDKIKSFDFQPLIEDAVGTIGGLIIPILPIGTIKEVFSYFKTQKQFRVDKGLLFTLSIFYLQKILQKVSAKNKRSKSCFVCKTTIAEADKLEDSEILNLISNGMDEMCFIHMVAYLEARKFHKLTGKSLLIAMKSADDN